MKQYFTLQNLKKVMFWFLITFPIFEIPFFYNSITTLVRMILLLLMFLWLLFLVKKVRKTLKWLIGYFLLLGIYFFFHHFHALTFTSLVPGNFHYSILRELLYFLKLSMPVVIIPLFYYLKFNKKEVLSILKGWIILISGSIIVTNFFSISLGSYSDCVIAGNLFTWFFMKQNGYTYYELASKGFFMYANQISTWLLIMVPICFLWILKKGSKKSVIYSFCLLFSMVLLGTRVASIGGILLFIFCFFVYLFFVFLKRESFDKKVLWQSIMIIVPLIILLPFSPSVNRANVLGNIEDTSIAVLVMNKSGYIKPDQIRYIEEHYEEKRILDRFILESYPYQYDPDFWYNILKLPVEKRIDYRYLETAMVKRVVEINHDPLDHWLGITNTRIQNIFNIERDFVLQYYAFGIIGCLLFFLPYLYLGYRLMKQLVLNFNLKNSFGLGIYLLYFAISYVSGNNMNHLSTIIPFLFLVCVFWKNEKSVKEENIGI